MGFLCITASSQRASRGPGTFSAFTFALLKNVREQGHTLDVRRLLEYVQYEVRVASPKQAPYMSFLMHPGRDVLLLPPLARAAPTLPARISGSLKVSPKESDVD